MRSEGWTEGRGIRLLATALSILAVLGILGLHYGSTLGRLGLHDLLRRLFYLPIIIAAIASGRRGGLLTSGMAVIGFLPHLQQLMRAGDRMVDSQLELVLMPVVGLIVGGFADSSRRLRAIAVERGRLAAIGEVGVAVMKQMEGPLGAIEGQAQALIFLGARLKSRSVSVSAELIRGEAHRVHRFLDDLRGLGRVGERGRSSVDLSAVVREMVHGDLRQDPRLVVGPLTDDLRVFADRAVLAFSLRSLLSSLLEVVPESGGLELDLLDAADGRAVIEIRVCCQGRVPGDFVDRLHSVFGANPGEYHFQPTLSLRSLVAQGALVDLRCPVPTQVQLRIRFPRVWSHGRDTSPHIRPISIHGTASTVVCLLTLMVAGRAAAEELPALLARERGPYPVPRAHRAMAFAAEGRTSPASALSPPTADAVPAQLAEHLPAGQELSSDSLLAGLIREALGHRPELTQAQAAVEADYARVPQAAALPDPVLSLGIQNDGFKRLQIGQMETSWWSIGAAQTFPWHGKRGLRARTQTLAALQSETDLERTRLSVQAEVERAYVDLLLVRDQFRILGRLESLWVQAEGLTRSRYEAGDGAQSDIIRSQLERGRLKQQRWSLTAEERRRLAELNRSVGRPLEGSITTTLSLAEILDPTLPDSAAAEADALARTPELRKARLVVEQSEVLVSLAKRDYFPDLTVAGGIMPRGAAFEPMWQASLSIPIPLWAGSKQSRAVGEYRLRKEAAAGGAEVTLRLVRQRLDERRALLAALLETNQLYRSGLLVQSEATVSSATAQYKVGRVPFASVLEALSGYLGDLVGFYESVAASQRIDIAQRELSLDPVAGPAIGAPGSGSMPGSSGAGGPSAPAGNATGARGAGSASTAMPKM